ncbi:hypothetical protein RJ640_012349 [Escallonia rubra]|uniref:Retrotransposon Copia-like N-terminal domain-containing protein n=1 Tax=Escallonia rubra TaxID=112253 RepID=A0AA88QJ38_9ASTE|nr:hypothetical protein RJ640_012349 [Escallonia rubra]
MKMKITNFIFDPTQSSLLPIDLERYDGGGDVMEDESASYVHKGLAPVANVQNVTIDTKSPFYLHPSDHPGLIFVTQSLSENGENYFTWRSNMLTALQSKNKAGFVDESIAKPNVHSGDFQSWIQCNAMVKSWIVNSLSRELQTSAAHADTARLDEAYKTVRSQIMSIDPLLGLGRAYIVAAQEEKWQVVVAAHVPTIEATTLLAKAPHMRHGGDQKTDRHGENPGERWHGGLHCTQCNRSIHSRENYYEIIRYPPR